MKTKISILATAAGLLLCALFTLPASALGLDAHYYHKKTTFEQLGGRHFDVVFIGDSITERSLWAEMFPNVAIANRGIGGDRADGILKRMDSILNTEAEKAFIMIGINDIAKGIAVETIYANYQKIIDQLMAAKMDVVVQATLLTDRDNDWNKDVHQLNRLVKAYAQQQQLTYVDLNPLLATSGSLNQDYSNDGLHLNGAAYVIWQQQIAPLVR